MVAYADDPKLERGMLMSITRDGTLDSIALEVGGSVGVEAPSVSIPLYRSSNCAPLKDKRCLVYSIPSSPISGTVVEWIRARVEWVG
jgi:hypothetical protein